MTNRRYMEALLLVGAVGLGGCSAEHGNAPSENVEAERAELTSTRFYIAPPRTEAIQQIASLARHRHILDAARVAAMVTTPHAVWLVGGTPGEVSASVRKTMRSAALERAVPAFVAYNLPYRDCSGYSKGGALDTAAYEAWIDAVANGIGDGRALVILEPDGLGIIPNNTTIYGQQEGCTIALTDDAGNVVTDEDGKPVPRPDANPSERYAQLDYALTTLHSAAPNAAVYLDASHSGWLGVGEAAYRLVQAGVANAAGFFVNVSNTRPTDENLIFGHWVSACIAAATNGADSAIGHFDSCPSQYNPDLDYARDYSPEHVAQVDAQLADMLGDAVPTTHFVIDTGRNGQGPWTPTASYPDAQDWCNAPGRGVGLRPSTRTGDPLVDAFLWVKVPGESDGSCNRGIAGSTTDPEWGGIVDPAAGEWFPDAALELAQLANPPLL